jgi:hypothetical protein
MTPRLLKFLIFALVLAVVADCTPPDNKRPAPGIVNGVMNLSD